ncbi:SH3 domain-containing protein [Streptomyces sp. NPDC018045]|uniref:SH3 domain-containing protein n=1 Tax=Streptomyces sp. NPDC018045 TaxID=3365037 RepID=UPI0037B15542
MIRFPRAATALAATAAAFALAGSTVATAATSSAPARQAASPAVQAVVCTVNDNGVNYRGGPGTNYPVLGQVNRGQKMNARGREGSWIMGDLWGGRTGVWIHVAYLNC